MKAVATLTISNARAMTVAGRAAVANWLALQGGELIHEGRKYGRRFHARYVYERQVSQKDR